MFGLFEKKKKETTASTNPEYLELVKKWDTFLDKINTRFEESLVNAEEALLENLEESNYDLLPTTIALNSMKMQIDKLSDKVEETFDNKVEPQMLNYVDEGDVIDEGHKGVELNESMYLRLEKFEIVIEGKVSQKFYDHAIKEFNQDFKCTQCSGKLEVTADIFRSHYISCDYCNTVNTFNPSDKMAQIRGIIGSLVKYKAIAEWETMREAQEAYRNLPSRDDDEDKTDLKNAFQIRKEKEQAFWLKYFTIRAEYLAEYKDTIAHDVEVKMRYTLEEEKNI